MSATIEEKRCETCGGYIKYKWSRLCECCRAENRESERSEGFWWGEKKVKL